MNISPVNLLNFKSSAQKNTRYTEPKGSNSTSPTYANASAEILRANYCPQLSFKGKGEDRLEYTPEEVEEMLRTLEEPNYDLEEPEELEEPDDDETTVGDLLEQREYRLGYRSPEELEEIMKKLKTLIYGDETAVGDSLEKISPKEVEKILKKLKEPSDADTIKRERSPEKIEEMLGTSKEPNYNITNKI